MPIAVLMCFIAMKFFGVDANIVALSGIAIAIGTMVDMGIVLMESMVTRIDEHGEKESLFTSIYEATTEVAGAVITAVATTVISFIPVFTMQAAEGKLFKPLAYTKTFALVASIIVAITIIPPLAHTIFGIKLKNPFRRKGNASKSQLQTFFSRYGHYLKNALNHSVKALDKRKRFRGIISLTSIIADPRHEKAVIRLLGYKDIRAYFSGIEKEIREVSHKLSNDFESKEVSFTNTVNQLLKDKSYIGNFSFLINPLFVCQKTVLLLCSFRL